MRKPNKICKGGKIKTINLSQSKSTWKFDGLRNNSLYPPCLFIHLFGIPSENFFKVPEVTTTISTKNSSQITNAAKKQAEKVFC